MGCPHVMALFAPWGIQHCFCEDDLQRPDHAVCCACGKAKLKVHRVGAA